MSGAGVLEAVGQIIGRGGDSEDVLQAIVGPTPASPSRASDGARRSFSRAHTSVSSRSTGSTTSR